MRNKIFGFKSITNLIYGLLMCMPLFAVLGRVIYTQSNPNAKDSYSDNYVEKTTLVNSTNLLLENSNYILNYSANSSAISNVSFAVNDTNLYDYIDTNNKVIKNLFFINENYPRLNIEYTDTTTRRIDNWNNLFTSFTFTLSSTQWNPSNTNIDYANLYLITYQNNKLDNAFEYSIKSFTDENNLGSIDFFGWFTDLFLNQSNTKNALYLNFANWYMNYCLLVSSGYLLFLCLIWFTQYIRRILDKSMNHDFGGF